VTRGSTARPPERLHAALGSGEELDPHRAVVEIDGRRLTLSNLDKVLYPAAGFTKGQVIDYYARIAPVLLPHLADRPLTMRRFPAGVEDPRAFYEKHRPRGAPAWVRSVRLPPGPRATGTVDFVVVGDLATLIWVANLAALELHVPQWQVTKTGTPQVPDLLVFDLDPGEPASVVECAQVALVLAELVGDRHGWHCHPKTSGSKGLQLYVRLPEADRQRHWDDGGTRELARRLAVELARARPELVVARMNRELRTGRVLIDWSQNHVAKTTIAPYSLRARTRPTVSAPVTWDEIRDAAGGDASRLTFGPDEVLARAERDGDLLAPLLG
jgi:bifunctional non-homologous end joining protein LigD